MKRVLLIACTLALVVGVTVGLWIAGVFASHHEPCAVSVPGQHGCLEPAGIQHA